MIPNTIQSGENSKDGGADGSGYEENACVVNVNWNSFNGEWNVNTWNRDENDWNAGKRIFSPETRVFIRPDGRIFMPDFDNIISIDNLTAAWQEFLRGKRSRKDVQAFECDLEANISDLHAQLRAGMYEHGSYHAFKISDPKPRDIHKAAVRDRLLHHAIYRQLYPAYDRSWIADSYSCRNGKGTHRAMDRFQRFFWKVSKSNTRTCWVLKCDIRKFFASIDHCVLMRILEKKIQDARILSLMRNIIESFHSTQAGKGLPLGNLTSQMLVNIYMNEFDQFAKHRLKGKCYIRYADDFVFMSDDWQSLHELIPRISDFLETHLKLSLHPDKLHLSTFASGIDFLGWVHFPDHRVFRTSSKRRMARNLIRGRSDEKVSSYRGLLSYGNARKLSTRYLP